MNEKKNEAQTDINTVRATPAYFAVISTNLGITTVTTRTKRELKTELSKFTSEAKVLGLFRGRQLGFSQNVAVTF